MSSHTPTPRIKTSREDRLSNDRLAARFREMSKEIDHAKADAARVLVANRNPDAYEHQKAVERALAIDDEMIKFRKAWREHDVVYRLPYWKPLSEDAFVNADLKTPLLTPTPVQTDPAKQGGISFDDLKSPDGDDLGGA